MNLNKSKIPMNLNKTKQNGLIEIFPTSFKAWKILPFKEYYKNNLNILEMEPIELFLPEGLQSPTLRLLHEVLWDYSRFHAGLPACYEASFSNHSSCDR